MPWHSARREFACSTELPMLIRDAARADGAPSINAWLQRVVATAVADVLGLDAAALVAAQPGYRGGSYGRFAGFSSAGDDTVTEPDLHSKREGAL
jgi:predicted RNase H-like nuclease